MEPIVRHSIEKLMLMCGSLAVNSHVIEEQKKSTFKRNGVKQKGTEPI